MRALLATLFIFVSFIQAASPQVDWLFPIGAQRGSEALAQIGGKYNWPLKVWSESDGIKFVPDKEKKGFKQLIGILKKLDENEDSEAIQTKIYDIGISLNFENLKDWFSAFYEVVLGQSQGPRLGSFIKFYGIEKTIKLLESNIT